MNIRRSFLASLVLLCAVVMVAQPVFAQQYVQKWDMYAGYTYLNTPTNSMSQYGYNLSFGRNLRNWLALGADFSNFRGTGAQITTGTVLAGKLPASVIGALSPEIRAAVAATTFNVPFNASTTTFAAGTQFQVRKTKWVTPFFRPFLGAFHAKAQGKPTKITATQLPPGVTPEMLAAVLNSVLVAVPQATLNKALTQDATVMGYGVGAGIDLNLSRPIGVRIATDYIRTPLFGARQNNIRIGFGLIYRFGGEMKHK